MLISGDGGAAEYHENKIVTSTGEERIIAWHNNLLRNEKNEIVGTLSAGEDITARKVAEEIVKTDKLRQNILITLSQQSDLSIKYIMDYALDAAQVLLRSTLGYLYYYDEEKRIFTLYEGDDEETRNVPEGRKPIVYECESDGTLEKVAARRRPVVIEHCSTDCNSKECLSEGFIKLRRSLNVPVFEEDRIVAVIGVANKEKPYDENDVRNLQLLIDGIWKIRKRIEMEEQIRRLNEELDRKVEDRTRELIQVHEELTRFFTLTLDLLCIVSIDGYFIRCNKAWESTLGYPADYLEGRRFLDFVHPEDVGETVSRFSQLKKGMDVIDFVNRCRCSDSTYRWIEWRFNSVGDMVYAAARDITEKKRYEEALIRAKEEADLASRAKSRFIATISHEIRTPLNAVIGYSELLSTMSIGNKEHSYIESIMLAGRSLLRLINDILDLSKIEAGMMTFRYSAVDIIAILKEIQQIFSFTLLEKRLSFSIDAEEPIPEYLVLDEARIRQILLNLVGNAVKFTEKGYVKVIVKCSQATTGLSKVNLDIIVEDSGIGIPEEEKNRIFEAFRQQSELPSRYGGTGLGLSISKKLLEMMNGSITVESTVGKGSRFIVHLPDVAIASIAPSKEGEANTTEDQSFSKKLVLVVDDIPSNRDMIAALLSEAGLEVIVAQNGEAAVNLAKERKPSCIIMDILMPGLDGVSAAKIIRRTCETKNIPIIALTTVPQPDIISKNDIGNFVGILSKPVTSRDLFRELKKHLSLKDKNSMKYSTCDFFDSDISGNNEALLPEYKKMAQDLMGAVKMEDIRKYAQKLIDLGADTGIPRFKSIGKKLAESADHFDIVGVRNILRQLGGLSG